MSIRQGNTVLAAGQSLTQDLFDFKWSDHILNDAQWLRADTFSWHDGSLYEAAYQHLLDDFNNGTRVLDSTGVWYYSAQDGHKIVDASDTQQVTNVENLYTSTGVAWYYIIDTINELFKLPRTKYGFSGFRDQVGNYIPESLPNITGEFDNMLNGTLKDGGYTSGLTTTNTSGAFTRVQKANTDWHIDTTNIATNQNGHYATSFDASRSSSAYKNGAVVQERSIQMYLYFFVGYFSQSALINTAGMNANLFNNKADLDLSNTPMATADYVIEWQRPTSSNNYEWYRFYKSGWVEQGGIITNITSSYSSKTIPIEMADTNYTLITSANDDFSGNQYCVSCITSTITFKIKYTGSGTTRCDWEVKGIAK